ncbi:hypothetical protein [Caballeronia sp. TF1N1]|uniref:hypothetical protein n=1 Tax=Caballeronia sp. TF1N1 TaxID=2878153 RepID=UPI001FD46FC3|nr:hypothetical protein [Caballeronia sp. TF1N1]
MSGYAHQWAKRQRVGDSSAKTLLKTYANWAAEDYSTWVTNDELELDTELNIQTIRRARSKLIELGYLLETDKRLGRTQSIIIYQMLAPIGATIVQSVDPRNGKTISLSPPTLEEYVAKRGEKASHSKARRSKGGEISSPSNIQAPTNPNSSPSKSHVEGGEISPEAPPNFDTKIALVEKEKNLDQKLARPSSRVALHEQLRKLELPELISADVWGMWCEHREAKEKQADIPWTHVAAAVSIKKLVKLAAAGQTPEVTVEESAFRGWTGLFLLKPESGGAAANSGVAIASDWWKTSTGIETRGKQLAVVQQATENFSHFKARVFKAAGPGEWMEDMLRTVGRESEERYEQLYAYFNDVPRDKNGNQEAA